eukprot:358727-Chlamydomonas_euryale.AAC.9
MWRCKLSRHSQAGWVLSFATTALFHQKPAHSHTGLGWLCRCRATWGDDGRRSAAVQVARAPPSKGGGTGHLPVTGLLAAPSTLSRRTAAAPVRVRPCDVAPAAVPAAPSVAAAPGRPAA